MPKFIYTLLVTTIACWALFLYLISQTPPDTTVKILFASVALFVNLTLTFTTIVFLIFHKRSVVFIDQHHMFIKALRSALFISATTTGYLLLRAFAVSNLLNSLLYFALCYIIYSQIRSRRREY